LPPPPALPPATPMQDDTADTRKYRNTAGPLGGVEDLSPEVLFGSGTPLSPDPTASPAQEISLDIVRTPNVRTAEVRTPEVMQPVGVRRKLEPSYVTAIPATERAAQVQTNPVASRKTRDVDTAATPAAVLGAGDPFALSDAYEQFRANQKAQHADQLGHKKTETSKVRPLIDQNHMEHTRKDTDSDSASAKHIKTAFHGSPSFDSAAAGTSTSTPVRITALNCASTEKIRQQRDLMVTDTEQELEVSFTKGDVGYGQLPTLFFLKYPH
jgi:hypothetical protein